MGTANRAAGQIRTRHRSTDLRAMIMEAAEYAFSQLGYKGATMAGIAERAGVTRSVLTRHFATKAELFAEVMTKPLLQFADGNSRAHVGALRLLMFSDEHLEPAVRQQVAHVMSASSPSRPSRMLLITAKQPLIAKTRKVGRSSTCAASTETPALSRSCTASRHPGRQPSRSHPGVSQYGARRPGNIGKCRTLRVRSCAPARMAVAAIARSAPSIV